MVRRIENNWFRFCDFVDVERMKSNIRAEKIAVKGIGTEPLDSS
jgi:hypothetical protein